MSSTSIWKYPIQPNNCQALAKAERDLIMQKYSTHQPRLPNIVFLPMVPRSEWKQAGAELCQAQTSFV